MFLHDFPIFSENPSLIFLDSASSAQKPRHVIDGMKHFFERSYANVHRWAYDLSMESSLLYEKAKKYVAKFLSASSESEIVFTYNATYAFNLIAHGLARSGILKKGDTILLSKLDHHANIVPWHIIAKEYDLILDWVDLHDDGTLSYESLAEKLPHARLLSITGASNVTGELLDIERVHALLNALENRPLFVLDGSQRFPHVATDVVKYGIDFYVGTGHKVMSDTGLGFFYGKKELLKAIDPVFCGGWAINAVTTEWYEPAGLPFRHEPGTPHIAGGVSLLHALEYIESIGWYEAIEKYENGLTEYALSAFQKAGFLQGPPSKDMKWITLLGSYEVKNRLWVFSFASMTHHPHDIAEALADKNICVRSGHHCTEPFHAHMGLGASFRASTYIYNTREDIDSFIETLKMVI